VTTPASWLRCYRCWSQDLEVQVKYEGTLKVDAETGEAGAPDEETLEAVVQCTDCLHDQPHLAFSLHEEEGRRLGRLEAIEDRWERLVLGTPWVASCTVTVESQEIEVCSAPEGAEHLTAGPSARRGRASSSATCVPQARGRADRRPPARRALRPLG
jgi:hypothetical protein